jgi:hypothetical protein
MRTLSYISMIIVVCATTFLTSGNAYAAPYHADSTNLFLNGGFEAGDFSPTGSPDGWWPDAYISSAAFLWDDTQAHEGNRSVKITAETLNDARWVQTVSVQPNTIYQVSGWIKTENVARTEDRGANLSLLGTWSSSVDLFGTNDWTYVSFNFNSRERTEVTIAARLGFSSGMTTGIAWFDDLELAPLLVQDSGPHPGWKILVLIYDTVDFTFTDDLGASHYYFTVMTQEQKEQAALTATKFVEEDIPALTSGNMIPTVTVRYPERALTELSTFDSGWWPAPGNVSANLDPAFDSVIVIWNPWVVDEVTGQTTFIGGGAAGLTPDMGTRQTYSAIIIDAATWYGHRNVFKHEWGHSITSFYDAYGTAPQPGVFNHINTTDTQYVHCPSGEPYILEDETPDNPIPNSIYNNDSGFTHDYYSGTTATPDQPTRCLGITSGAWASGGPVSKPLRPPQSSTPAQQIQSIRDHIDQFVLSGDLAKGHATPLYVRLDAANQALEDEQDNLVVKSLQNFVKKVEGLMKTKRLPEAEGLILIDQATILIDQFND